MIVFHFLGLNIQIMMYSIHGVLSLKGVHIPQPQRIFDWLMSCDISADDATSQGRAHRLKDDEAPLDHNIGLHGKLSPSVSIHRLHLMTR